MSWSSLLDNVLTCAVQFSSMGSVCLYRSNSSLKDCFEGFGVYLNRLGSKSKANNSKTLWSVNRSSELNSLWSSSIVKRSKSIGSCRANSSTEASQDNPTPYSSKSSMYL